MTTKIIFVLLIVSSHFCFLVMAEENNTKEIKKTIELDVSNVLQIAWNYDLSMFAVLTGEEIWVWSTDTWELMYMIPDAYSYEIAWHPNKDFLAGLNCCDGEKISIWDGETGELEIRRIKQMPEDTPMVLIRSAMAWSPDGNQIATDSWLDTLTLWEVESEEYHTLVPIIEPDGHDVINLAWSPSGQYLLSAGLDGYDRTSIRVWDAQTGENLAIVEGYKHIAWHPDETLFASAGKGNLINIWNVETNQVERSFAGHTHTITSIDWNTNGHYISSTDADGNLIIWNFPSGEQVVVDFQGNEHIRSATWRPDGLQLAVTTLEDITIFDW